VESVDGVQRGRDVPVLATDPSTSDDNPRINTLGRNRRWTYTGTGCNMDFYLEWRALALRVQWLLFHSRAQRSPTIMQRLLVKVAGLKCESAKCESAKMTTSKMRNKLRNILSHFRHCHFRTFSFRTLAFLKCCCFSSNIAHVRTVSSR